MMRPSALLLASALTFVVATADQASAQSMSDVPPSYVKVDTSGLTVSFDVLRASTRRNAAASGVVTPSTLSMQGVESTIRGRSIGLHLRYMDGTSSAGTVRDVDARLLLGDAGFSFELGYVQRTDPMLTAGALGLARAGVRLGWPIGASGAAVEVSGGGMINPRSNDTGATNKKSEIGWDGEATLRYQPVRWHLPFEGLIGYRANALQASGREVEHGQVIIGLGFRLSGR